MDRYAGQSGTLCREYIHVGVTHIYAVLGLHAQLSDGLDHHVGGRLAPYACMLTDGHMHMLGIELAVHHAYPGLQLVAHYGHAVASAVQRSQHLGYVSVGSGVVHAVFHVVGTELPEALLQPFGACALRYGPLYEPVHTVAHKGAHLVE